MSAWRQRFRFCPKPSNNIESYCAALYRLVITSSRQSAAYTDVSLARKGRSGKDVPQGRGAMISVSIRSPIGTWRTGPKKRNGGFTCLRLTAQALLHLLTDHCGLYERIPEEDFPWVGY